MLPRLRVSCLRPPPRSTSPPSHAPVRPLLAAASTSAPSFARSCTVSLCPYTAAPMSAAPHQCQLLAPPPHPPVSSLSRPRRSVVVRLAHIRTEIRQQLHGVLVLFAGSPHECCPASMSAACARSRPTVPSLSRTRVSVGVRCIHISAKLRQQLRGILVPNQSSHHECCPASSVSCLCPPPHRPLPLTHPSLRRCPPCSHLHRDPPAAA